MPGRRYGPLHARVEGRGGLSTVLLHGLVATGDVFGADFDKLSDRGPLVVPDLLGFGRSLDESRIAFGPEAHLDALDELMAATGLADVPLAVGAHSMGSALALRWAARHPGWITRIVCWGAPVYRNEAETRATISASGLMTRLFVADTRWAEQACALSCRHRTAAGWMAAAAQPSLPVPVSRAVPLHTWPAYRDAIKGLVLESDWPQLVAAAAPDTEIRLVWGTDDPIGNIAFAQTLLGADVEVIEAADHRLPMTDGTRCVHDLLSGWSGL